MKPSLKLSTTISALLLGLTACGGGGDTSPAPSLRGVAQIGSYVADSPISFVHLSSNGEETAERFDSKVNTDKGNYAVSLPWGDWTSMAVTGKFFNMVTEATSDVELTLNNITDTGNSSGAINVNMLTHLVAARTQELTAQGQLLGIAKQQALSELKELFGLSTTSIEKLDLTSAAEPDSVLLLLATAGLLATNQGPEALLGALITLTDDFSDNGLIDGEAKNLFQQISTYASGDDVLTTLSNNLKQQGFNNPPSAITLSASPAWITGNNLVEIDEELLVNQAPVAYGSADQSIIVGESVTLTGSGKDDDGTISSYQWRRDNNVVGNTATLTQTNLTVGVYTFILTVTDNNGDTATVKVIVTVKAKSGASNKAPTAKAGADQSATEGKEVTLSGSGSDADGTIASYEWTKKGVSVGKTATLKQSKLTVGDHTFILTVTDDKGATATDSVKITVKAKSVVVNKAPTAKAGADQSVTEGKEVTLSGSGSDSDGTIASYEWTKGGVSVGKTATLKQSKLTVGDHAFILTVTDDKGATATDSVKITVKAKPVAVNKAPTAKAGADQSVTEGQEVTLSGSGSDSDGTIVSYEWTKAGVSVGKTATLKQSKLTVGDHTFILTVTDNKGATATDSVSVTVTGVTVTLGEVTVNNLSDTRCATQGGLHLSVTATLSGGVTGGGPASITTYAESGCTGKAGSPISATASYIITNIEETGGGKRTGTMTVSLLGQSDSGTVNIASDGTVSRP